MNIYQKAISIEEAVELSKQLPSLPYNENPLQAKPKQIGDSPVIDPTKVFDNVYWIGAKSVGGILIDTTDGYILIDQGSSKEEGINMKKSIEELGLDPSKIKLLMISHEHFDHYGGTQYFKDEVCPKAKIAISRVGWNLLQTVPTEFAFIEPRIKQADILLTDGMCIQLGNTNVFVVATPGHSAGCISFIYNTTYHGEPINIAMMGGSAVWPNLPEARTYQSSVEYFKLFTDLAHCNAYTQVHASADVIQAIHDSWEGKGKNPWIVKEEEFEEVFYKPFRDRVYSTVTNPIVQRYMMPSGKDEGSVIAELNINK